MKNNIKFIEKEKYVADYGISSTGEYTPIYMIKNDKEYFVGNIVRKLDYYDGFDKYDYENRIKQIEKIKETLLNNNGDYFKQYCRCDNPFDFINWIKENKYTFEIHGELFRKGKTFTDFHGNLKQYSSAFNYRIYNDDIVNQLENLVKELI